MIKYCKVCQNPFWGYKSDEKYNRGKCCSRKCFFEYFKVRFPHRNVIGLHWKHTEEYKKRLSLARMGRKNPNYINGQGRTREDKPKLRKWRDEVFERDNWTCRVCGDRGGELNAHHIIQWCIDKEKRFDINNGLTVCTACHRKIHKNKLK